MPAVRVQYETRYHKMHKYIKCMNSDSSSKYYAGKICNNWVKLANENAVAALCKWCTGSLVPPPVHINRSDSSTKFPRGWKFKKMYVAQNGDVYFKGVLQPELHGQYDPTPIVVPNKKPKLSKHAKKELKYTLLRELDDLRKQSDNSDDLSLADTMRISSRRQEIEKQLKKL